MRINKTQIQNYLTIRYDPSVSNLNRASWSDFKPQYSDPSGKISEKLLVNSIKHSIPDTETPISISLSSGIDSSICLALLRKCFPKRKIFAICGIFEDGFDESIEAKKIADTFSAEFKILQMNSIFTNMPEIISVTKRPRWNTYNHLIAKEARKNTNMLITGDGADELFGGYVFRYKKFLQLLKSKDSWMEKTKKYLECHNRDWVPDQNEMFDKSIKFSWTKIYDIFKSYFQNKLDPITQVMLADFNGKLLFDFVPTGKSISNHYKIKNIPIFLDDSVVSFAQKLPLSQKFDEKGTKGKLVLRKISKKLGIKHIDEKKGFSPSLLFDWKKNGKSICQSFLLNKNSNVYEKNLINFDWVLRAFDKVEYDGDIRYLNRLISILALEIWIKLFVTRELKNSKKLL